MQTSVFSSKIISLALVYHFAPDLYLYQSKKREMWFQLGIITLYTHTACVLPYLHEHCHCSWQWKSLSHSAPDFTHSRLQISFCYVMLIELNSSMSKMHSTSIDVKQYCTCTLEQNSSQNNMSERLFNSSCIFLSFLLGSECRFSLCYTNILTENFLWQLKAAVLERCLKNKVLQGRSRE